MQAIIIARVSTAEQKEAGNSLPAQIERLQRYCQNKEFKIIKTFSFDESAYTNNRDGFDSIFNFIIEQKEKVAVCFDKVDRLSRNVFDKRVSMLYDKALKDEIELHFTSDGQVVNSQISAVEKFNFSISLGLAKYYSDAISDNVKRAMEAKLRKGEWVSKAPYGYKNINNDVVIDEYASRVVRKAFEYYATGSFSMIPLCKKLKEEYGVKWSKGVVYRVLKNPFYHGTMFVNNKAHPHRYPPIISKALFDQVQQIKDGFCKKPFKFAGKPYFYRGLLRCGDCGLAITPEKHKGHVYYHCTQSNGKHGAEWLREEAITEQLGEIFKRLQLPEKTLEQIVSTLGVVHQEKIEFQQKQSEKLNADRRTTTKMIDNLYWDKLKGSITDERYDKFYQSLRDQLADIDARLGLLQEAEDNYYVTAKYILDLTNRAYGLFLGSEMEERRQIIKLVLSNLTLNGKNIVWEAHKPFDLILNCSDRQVWRG